MQRLVRCVFAPQASLRPLSLDPFRATVLATGEAPAVAALAWSFVCEWILNAFEFRIVRSQIDGPVLQ